MGSAVPGELGNEEDGQQVGYYDRRYDPSGEWLADNPLLSKYNREKSVQNVLCKYLNKEKKTDVKSKSD